MRLIRLLIEEVLTCLPRQNVEIKNQCGDICYATKAMDESDVCGISMEDRGMLVLRAFSDISPASSTGVVSIRSVSISETGNIPSVTPPPQIHAQLPSMSSQHAVLLLDTQCTTGEKTVAALDYLVNDKQVSPSSIYYVAVISAFEGLQHVFQHFPDVTLITAQVDTVLDQQRRIRPGIGDFEQRFSGTNEFWVKQPNRSMV
ncbi:Uracil phosphoribosyltransferase [Phytophthora cinnamomi]|uniref:Uracil phosphoribosyltransferase n=1 Tax=Phytophthora cinnamomi TaxID=4785 RepID=UPI003559DDB1|nr:Uracil phosphoribosyltransferase [Phytophthora cinnamomi]